jgi:hypothetical protein
LLEGFHVEEIKQDHIFPFVIEKYIQYEYEILPWFAAMPQPMFTALEKKLGWHMLITARPLEPMFTTNSRSNFSG